MLITGTMSSNDVDMNYDNMTNKVKWVNLCYRTSPHIVPPPIMALLIFMKYLHPMLSFITSITLLSLDNSHPFSVHN